MKRMDIMTLKKAAVGDSAPYLFHEGTNYRAYEYMGCHRDKNGYVFRVWAPNADKAFVTGLFNGWSEDCPMSRVDDAGIWEAHVPDTSAATELILKEPGMFKDYEITKGKMDDVFLAVTGKKLTGGERE